LSQLHEQGLSPRQLSGDELRSPTWERHTIWRTEDAAFEDVDEACPPETSASAAASTNFDMSSIACGGCEHERLSDKYFRINVEAKDLAQLHLTNDSHGRIVVAKESFVRIGDAEAGDILTAVFVPPGFCWGGQIWDCPISALPTGPLGGLLTEVIRLIEDVQAYSKDPSIVLQLTRHKKYAPLRHGIGQMEYAAGLLPEQSLAQPVNQRPHFLGYQHSHSNDLLIEVVGVEGVFEVTPGQPVCVAVSLNGAGKFEWNSGGKSKRQCAPPTTNLLVVRVEESGDVTWMCYYCPDMATVHGSDGEDVSENLQLRRTITSGRPSSQSVVRVVSVESSAPNHSRSTQRDAEEIVEYRRYIDRWNNGNVSYMNSKGQFTIPVPI